MVTNIPNIVDEANVNSPDSNIFTTSTALSVAPLPDIFIGVDGGASKCRVRIEDADGNCLRLGSTGPASVKLSPAGAWQSIMTALQAMLQDVGGAGGGIELGDDDNNAPSSPRRHRFHIGCGLTGSELPHRCQEFLAIAPPCFTTVCLNSDAYTACLGAHAGKDGAIIIIGTGVVSLQIQQGKTVRVGGWGFPHGDEGGAAWLGMEAIRITFQWLDGRLDLPDSPLLAAIFRRFGGDLTEMVVWANSANSTEFAKIAPLVVEHLKEQEEVALLLIKRAAQEIDRVGLMLEKYTEGDQLLPCVALGGMVPFIEAHLCDDLRRRLVPPKHDAAVGAILMAKQKMLEGKGAFIK